VDVIFSGKEFEDSEKNNRTEKLAGDPSLKSKILKNIRELERLVGVFNSQKGTSSTATSIDRLMTDIRRTCVRVRKNNVNVVVNGTIIYLSRWRDHVTIILYF